MAGALRCCRLRSRWSWRRKTFTNGKDDKPLVKRLYEAAFKEQFGKATILGYDSLGWGDDEAVHVAEVLASGAAPRLKKLFLGHNKIGDKGCKALAAALGKEGAAPRLEELYIYTDRYRSDSGIGVEGYEALAAALEEGAAPRLKARAALPSPYIPSRPRLPQLPSRAQKIQAGFCLTDPPFAYPDSGPDPGAGRPVRLLDAVCEKRGIYLDCPMSSGY